MKRPNIHTYLNILIIAAMLHLDRTEIKTKNIKNNSNNNNNYVDGGGGSAGRQEWA